MKVAIAGYGREGAASYTYWQQLGANITIFDEKQPDGPIPKDAQTCFGADAFLKLQGFDLVIRTASLNPRKIHTDGKVWSATNEFFATCPAPIIGVTGTKGKGTTATLIAEILKAAGKTVHLLGNIGVPALEVLPHIAPDDFVVFELSSFQLWDLEKSPETAVVLMIEPDHQDIHASMAEYVEAKSRIAMNQISSDLLVYHPTNPYAAEIAATSKAQKKRYQTPEGAYIQDTEIIIEETPICAVNEVGLIGPHNVENICAAITAAWNYTQDRAAIKKAITHFKGLEHRLEFVRKLHGVMYYNDSFSSAPGATIAAVRSFIQPVILICGGYDKGINFSPLAQQLAEQENLKKVVLIGETRTKLAAAFDKASIDQYEILETTDFTTIISRCQKEASDGDVVLLSPGCASFDMFKNFYERGEQFKKIVMELA